MKGLMLGLALLLSACDAGPLPPPARPMSDEARRRDSYPTKSDDPLPLDEAILSNQIDKARQLLETGVDADARWGEHGDHFPLQEVFDVVMTAEERSEFVRLLLAHGANPSQRWCPFESRGYVPGYPSCTSAVGVTLLDAAARAGVRDIVQMLLAAGADPTPRDSSGLSALDYAFDEVIFEMIARAQFPNLATRDRQSLEWLAHEDMWRGTPLSRALGHGFDGGYLFPPRPPDAPEDRWTATERRVLQRLNTLMRIGVDPNERIGINDWTPLSVALDRRQYRAARLLLNAGADANQRWCAQFVVRDYRLRPEADPACTVSTGTTPLMWAAISADREAVELLLEFKADRALRDWQGQSAADRAKTPEIKQLLLEPR